MAITHQLRHLASAALIGGGIVFGVISTPIVFGALAPAAAQISEDAQVALEQYGSWRPHPRFGNVWVPTGVPPDWRPYAYGHWVYTDEWGWYWVSDDVEADWGWVVYHYGRWAFERGFGWYWVSGDEWAPAWVDWRYGDDYSGWAPLPPEELVGTYEVEPTYWVFVPTRYMAAPRLRTYYVPVQRRSVILRSTHIVNRTFAVRGSHLAVNPGISPAFVARVSGAPVSTYRVRPRVFASTQGVAGAVQIRREDLRGARGGRPAGPAPAGPGARTRLGTVSVERTTAVIQPSAAVTAPQPLGKNETGRLGTHPPRAAQGVAPTPSVAPAQGQPPSPPPPPPPNAGAPTPPAGSGLRWGPPPSTTAPTTTAPTTAPTPTPSTTPPGGNAPAERPERREERRDLRPPAGAGGGTPPAGQPAPPTQPNIVRPIPSQTPPPPPPPPPQERRVQPPPPPPSPPPPQERRVQPPPPPPPPPQQRQAPPPPPPAAVRPPPPPPPPPAARAPAPPPAAPPPQRPAPPPKKPPPAPGEKPPEPPK
jgi:hypothetical protein